MCRGHRMRARNAHQRHLRSRYRQQHFNPADAGTAAPENASEGHILDDPEDPDDPLLEPVLHRGPHEEEVATKPPSP